MSSFLPTASKNNFTLALLRLHTSNLGMPTDKGRIPWSRDLWFYVCCAIRWSLVQEGRWLSLILHHEIFEQGKRRQGNACIYGIVPISAWPAGG